MVWVSLHTLKVTHMTMSGRSIEILCRHGKVQGHHKFVIQRLICKTVAGQLSQTLTVKQPGVDNRRLVKKVSNKFLHSRRV